MKLWQYLLWFVVMIALILLGIATKAPAQSFQRLRVNYYRTIKLSNRSIGVSCVNGLAPKTTKMDGLVVIECNDQGLKLDQ